MDPLDLLDLPSNPYPPGMSDTGPGAVDAARGMISLTQPWFQTRDIIEVRRRPDAFAYIDESFNPYSFVQSAWQPGRATLSQNLPIAPQPSEVQAQQEQELQMIQDLLPGAP